jgi:putative endopeptidase
MRPRPVRLGRPGTLAALAATALGVASHAAAQTSAPSTAPVRAAVRAQLPRPIDPANFDTTCAACTNFFEFANGGWLKKAAIPAAYSRWGSFEELSDQNTAVLREVIEASAAKKDAPLGSNDQKIGAYYRSCMDSAGAERAGLDPVRPLLQRIDGITSVGQMKQELGQLERESGIAPIGAGAGPDRKDSKTVIVNLFQGGTTLPDRDYYLSAAPRYKTVRDSLAPHIARMFVLAGEGRTQADSDAARVVALETRLAQAQMARVAMRNPDSTYHKMTVADLQRATSPGFDWVRYLSDAGAAGVTPATTVNVGQPAFFAALDTLYGTQPLATWKAYLRWHALSSAAPTLSSAFANEAFAFTRNLTGATEQLPRWKRCVGATNAALGELVGQEYVKRTFTAEDKARALAMVGNLQAALRERIQGLTWMSDSTKQQALAKLAAFTKKIGYPDKWRDYSALQVADTTYYDNARRARLFNQHYNWNKLGRPVDRTEWGMTPPTVNAYYNPAVNEIVFPAGILQPPFYNPKADDAVNYGAMGAVIGHEMTHGFDDQGRRFDAEGNLRDWWTAADAAKFKARAQRVVDQFSAYTVVDSTTHLNGQLTQGENIADLGGLTIAYAAMEKAYAGKPRPRIDGFTPEQRFFLGWAQVWRELSRPERARVLAATDPHSPGVYRVNGPLSNMPEFKRAWGCKDADPMVRPADQRASIW